MSDCVCCSVHALGHLLLRLLDLRSYYQLLVAIHFQSHSGEGGQNARRTEARQGRLDEEPATRTNDAASQSSIVVVIGIVVSLLIVHVQQSKRSKHEKAGSYLLTRKSIYRLLIVFPHFLNRPC